MLPAAPVNEPQDMYRAGNGCQMGGRGRSLVKALRVVPLWVCGLVGLWACGLVGLWACGGDSANFLAVLRNF